MHNISTGTGAVFKSNIRGQNWKRSLRVLVVGEQVVEDSEGGLEVQVDDIWKTRWRLLEGADYFKEFQEEKLDL